LRTLLLLVLLVAAQEPVPEYKLKAAFLYNFATYVEWPKDAFPDPRAPFRVGVCGKDPFGPILEDTFRGKTVGGRPIVVNRSPDAADLRTCQLVFVPATEGTSRALKALDGARALTVGEREGFAAENGCVNFYLEGQRVRFEINVAAAKRAELKISSKLLRLARMVGDAK
jgi:hypothetical protein